MHKQIFPLMMYCFLFLAGGCLAYVSFRINRHLAHAANKVPLYFFVMMISGLLAATLFDLIVFASVSFDFSRLHFAGLTAYTSRLDQPTAVTRSMLISIPALWISMRWLGRHQSKSSAM